MIDLLIIREIIKRRSQYTEAMSEKKERFRTRDEDEDDDHDDEDGDNYYDDDDVDREAAAAIGIGLLLLILLGIFVSLLLGVAAVYLSWSSNSVIGWDPVFKIIFALFAFFNPVSYLISHLLHKVDLLNFIADSTTPM